MTQEANTNGTSAAARDAIGRVARADASIFRHPLRWVSIIQPARCRCAQPASQPGKNQPISSA